MASVRVIQGPDKGKEINISDDRCVLGRDVDIGRVKDGSVSRKHARIYKEGKAFFIEDLNSANGTFVNGVRIARAVPLREGDHIRIGKTIMVFSEEEQIELPLDETEFGQLIDVDTEGSMVDSAIMSAIPSDKQVLLAPKEPNQANKHLRVLYELVSVTNSIFNVEQLMQKVMDLIFRELRVDRGFILMFDEKKQKLEPVVVKYRNAKQEQVIATSNTIIEHVIDKREGVLCTNAMSDQRFSKGESIQGFRISSVICVPLIAHDKILGIIHIDCASENFTYGEGQLHLLTAIGYQTGLAVQNVQLYHDSVKAERLAAAGQTVASLSHYIKNILQGLQGGADTVELGLRSENLRIAETGWRIVNRNLDKIQNLMLNMLALGKEREPLLEMTQLNAIVGDVMDLTQKRADDKGVMLLTDLDDNMPAIPVDSDGIHRVLLNIVNNAIDAVPENTGAVTIRTGFDEQSQQALLSVGDNGPGISSDEAERVFDMFHSTKGHSGTGLGLAVSKKIVEEHNGTIEVSSHEQGTIFTIKLPANQPKYNSSEQTSGVSETH